MAETPNDPPNSRWLLSSIRGSFATLATRKLPFAEPLSSVFPLTCSCLLDVCAFSVLFKFSGEVSELATLLIFSPCTTDLRGRRARPGVSTNPSRSGFLELLSVLPRWLLWLVADRKGQEVESVVASHLPWSFSELRPSGRHG